jgi:hypothetical protein
LGIDSKTIKFSVFYRCQILQKYHRHSISTIIEFDEDFPSPVLALSNEENLAKKILGKSTHPVIGLPIVFVVSLLFLIKASDRLTDSAQKIEYSLASSFSGRYCNTSFEGSQLNRVSLGNPVWAKIFFSPLLKNDDRGEYIVGSDVTRLFLHTGCIS